jgi:acetyltransferase EpsM
MATLETAAQAADPDRPVSRRRLVILGAGEHARVVADAARSGDDGWDVEELAGEAAEAALRERLAASPPADRPALVIGFGASATACAAAAARFDGDVTWATIVHSTAWISPTAELAPGAVVLAGAVVNAGARIGRHAIVNTGAIVEHDVRLGDFVHIAPGATLGGGTAVGEGAQVGLGAAVRDHVSIGAWATVGMGAVVVADVPADAVVVGNPARAVERAADA